MPKITDKTSSGTDPLPSTSKLVQQPTTKPQKRRADTIIYLNRLPEAVEEFKETWLGINPERLLLKGIGYRALDKVAKHDFRRVVMGLKERVDEVVEAMEEIDRNERK
jgi:hypothetical protein